MNLIKSLNSKLTLLVATMIMSVMTFAQDKKIDVTIDTKPDAGNAENFFMQPWVWVVGGAIFLLLLVALMRGNSNKS